ncbi:MAG: LPS-assembly protein LptD [bacterium ADurb.Bin363]|nr:MAG: LPS-assembly protein LptD [bacterium ADurb.Bin363]
MLSRKINISLVIFFFLAFIICCFDKITLNVALSQGQAKTSVPTKPAVTTELPSGIPSVTDESPSIPRPFTPLPKASPVSTPSPVATVSSSSKDGEEKTRVQISSDNLSGDDNKKTFRFWGNVNIQQKDAVLISDEATFNSKTNVAVASNNVKFTKPGTTITANKVTVYYDEKRGIWEGSVYIVQDKDKKGDKTLKDGPVELYCDSLEFIWEKPREGIAIGNVKVHQKDKHVSCDKATYTEDPQTILMENNVRLEKDDGSWMTCDKMTLHVKEETMEGEGNVKGNFVVNEEGF